MPPNFYPGIHSDMFVKISPEVLSSTCFPGVSFRISSMVPSVISSLIPPRIILGISPEIDLENSQEIHLVIFQGFLHRFNQGLLHKFILGFLFRYFFGNILRQYTGDPSEVVPEVFFKLFLLKTFRTFFYDSPHVSSRVQGFQHRA